MGSVIAVGAGTTNDGGFAIGVTGHRPDRLSTADLPAIRVQTAAVLDALATWAGSGRNGWDGSAPGLLIVSSLAEGADRLMAEVGMERGGRLLAILPFARAEFARDFATAASVAEFDALLDRAAEMIELPGARGDHATDAAYEAAAAAVLDHSDVLLAIWDGEAGRGIGGTAHTIAAAIAQGIPVVRIAARTPHEVTVPPIGANGLDGSGPGDWGIFPISPGGHGR